MSCRGQLQARAKCCIGFHLARLMSEVMVKAVLDRIPDYQVDLDV
jgi:cytochrome P450